MASKTNSRPRRHVPTLKRLRTSGPKPVNRPRIACRNPRPTVRFPRLKDEFMGAQVFFGDEEFVLGTGATAKVTLMYRKDSRGYVPYAVKEFKKRTGENYGEYQERVRDEYEIARRVCHPNIAKTHLLAECRFRLNSVMEFCGQGDLLTLVKEGYLTVEDKLCLFKQLLQGVAYLHSQGIAHLDLKLDNVLLHDSSLVKISDFGLSTAFARLAPKATGNGEKDCELVGFRKCSPGLVGTLPYIAPEVLGGTSSFDPRAADVWSCAITGLILFANKEPWEEASTRDIHYRHFKVVWNKIHRLRQDGLLTDADKIQPFGYIFSSIPGVGLRRLVLRMLHPNPAKRITIFDALNDARVKSIECCSPAPACVSSSSAAVTSKPHDHRPPTSDQGEGEK